MSILQMDLFAPNDNLMSLEFPEVEDTKQMFLLHCFSNVSETSKIGHLLNILFILDRRCNCLVLVTPVTYERHFKRFNR